MRLPDGRILTSTIACKIAVELNVHVIRRCTFIVVDVTLPFVLGMAFLRKTNAVLDVAKQAVILHDDKVAESVILNASAKSYTCRLSAMAAEAENVYTSTKFANIYACSAK